MAGEDCPRPVCLGFIGGLSAGTPLLGSAELEVRKGRERWEGVSVSVCRPGT